MPTIWESLLDLVFPPRQECPFCKVPTDDASVCADCQDILRVYQSESLCRLCGRFHASGGPLDGTEGYLCADCHRAGRPFDLALAPGPHEGILKETIHRFKYGGERYLAEPLAELMTAQLRRTGLLNNSPDLLLAVPLSNDKLLSRGFNQAGLLAKEISIMTAIPFKEQVLEKVTQTPSQTSLPKAMREVNLYGAFRVTDKTTLTARKVLLVDDVFTTGSTVSVAAEVLKAAGAVQVYVITATTGRSN